MLLVIDFQLISFCSQGLIINESIVFVLNIKHIFLLREHIYQQTLEKVQSARTAAV